MGEVWRARLRSTGTPVAVKLLHPEAVSPERIERFTSELRRTARLDHPHVVDVLDYGTLDRTVAASLDRSPSQPWYAMEWLPQHLGNAPVPDPRAALAGVLSGLAHAHAAGLVHRDVKPANLLLDADGAVRVADFGVAAGALDGRRRGTLATMAPEQLRGEPLGPWTDLYGVGCVAWFLLTGSLPLPVADPEQALWARLHFEAPPTPGWPDGVREWVLSLLQPDPAHRPQHAADALARLLALPPLPATPTPLADEASETLVTGEVTGLAEPLTSTPAQRTARLDPGPPPSVRREVSTGLRLWGLREPPLVGREALVHALWADSSRALDTEAPVVSVLHGAPGVGKTRLAAWVAARLAERGFAAVTLRMGQAGTEDAVRRGLESAPWWLPSPLPGGLPDLLANQPVSAAELRMGLLAALREARRPVVLVVDDLHASAFARDLLKRLRRGDVPIWVVATWLGPPELPDGLDARLYPVPPLAPEAVEDLVTRLGADPAAASLLTEHAGGNPLFATSILTGWLAEGRLDDGFRAPRPQSLPTELVDLLDARIAPWTDRPAWGALLHAAALGVQVESASFSAVCRAAGIDDSPEHVEALLRAGLVEPTSQGFAFTHRLLRDAVLRTGGEPAVHRRCAEVLDRVLPSGLASTSARIAEQLEAAGDRDAARAAWLRCLHETEASGPDGFDAEHAAERVLALDPPPRESLYARYRLLRMHTARSSRVDMEARAALEAEAEALGEPSLARELRLIRVWHHNWVAEIDEAMQWCERLAAEARAAGDRPVLTSALGRLGGLLERKGRSAEAARVLEEAVASAAPGPKKANLLSILAELRSGQGDPHGAREAAEAAAVEFARGGRRSTARNTNDMVLAELTRRRGEWELARERLHAARKQSRDWGAGEFEMVRELGFLGLALCDVGQERHVEALERLDALHERLAARKHPFALLPRVHAARVRARLGDWGPARALFGAPRPRFLPDPDLAEALEELAASAPSDLKPTVEDWITPWRTWQGR